MRFAPSPVRVARLHLAAFVPFSAASIEKLRKDFLTLLKNVDRVASYEDLVKLQEASRVWDAHYKEELRGLVKGLTDTMWFVHTGDTKRNQYFEPQVKVSIAYWSQRINEASWPLHIEMTSLPYERLEEWLDKGGGRFTAEQGKADILVRWNRDKKKWSDKAKLEARKVWSVLDEYTTWVGQRREGVAPVQEVQEVYRQEVEGFSVTFIGMDREASYLREGVQKLKVGLAHYRERAAKVFPLLLGPAKLPIQFRGDQGLDCGGRYEHGNHIVICPISSPPKEYAHVIAHEMGHHVYQTYLSEGAQRFWSAAIRGDYGEADLNDILAEWRDGEFSLDVVQRLAKTDPILALQIDGLIRQHDWGPREDAVRYLQKHGPKVHVPTTPITGYATKNTEEAFCEAVGRLVGYGPRAVHPLILHWLKIILPREVKVARTASAVRVVIDVPATLDARQKYKSKDMLVGRFDGSLDLYRVFDAEELELILSTGRVTGGSFSIEPERAFGASWGADLADVIKFGLFWQKQKRLGYKLYVAKINGSGKTFAHLHPKVNFDPNGPDEQTVTFPSLTCSTGLGCSVMDVSLSDVEAFYQLLPDGSVSPKSVQDLRSEEKLPKLALKSGDKFSVTKGSPVLGIRKGMTGLIEDAKIQANKTVRVVLFFPNAIRAPGDVVSRPTLAFSAKHPDLLNDLNISLSDVTGQKISIRKGTTIIPREVKVAKKASPIRVEGRYLSASTPLILRPEGWGVVSEEALDALNSWRKSGHVYRAMTEPEYKDTVGARKPVWSRGDFSHSSEGTNFSDDPLDAESYVNFGRTDPRKTGKPTYLVEVATTDSMSRWRDGYIKSPVPVPYENVTRVWEMTGEDGAVVARRIK